ncbi:MAG: flavodoxin [Burkholderiaceae bacterium]|nr:flavodoxin [Burkholderiaceae bacterium]
MAQDGKKWIVYYSLSGDTREIARQIQASTGADITELELVEAYPTDSGAMSARVKRELAGARPALKALTGTVDPYAVLFVGSPNWGGTIAPALAAFLSQQDLSGKMVAPFMAHGGGGLGRSVADIQSLCPNATVLEGLAIRGKQAGSAGEDIAQWLKRLGMVA